MILDPILDIFRGRTVTIPPMDGALKPNTALEDADLLIEAASPDNLCSNGTYLFFSSGNRILGLEAGTSGAPGEVAGFDRPVTALAALPGGPLAIALDDGRLQLLAEDGETRDLPAPEGLACPTALAFDAAGTSLYVCQGSARHGAGDWAVDLMEKNASGSVWRFDLVSGRATCLARDLAFPNGLLVLPGGPGIIVSESWRHRLVGIPAHGGGLEPLLSKLPGYPARLTPAADGGSWLALFAPRNRLIEFTLLEGAYRREMMREVPRDCWIAPALASESSFLEPLQCGGVKTMGIHKPWSPSRSYGLVVKLDAKLRPTASFHSRANGKRHGVTSVAEFAGRVLVGAKGGNVILDIGTTSGGAG